MDARAWLTHWASLGTDRHRQQLFVALLTEHEACQAARAEAEQRAEKAEQQLEESRKLRASQREAQSAHGRGQS